MQAVLSELVGANLTSNPSINTTTSVLVASLVMTSLVVVFCLSMTSDWHGVQYCLLTLLVIAAPALTWWRNKADLAESEQRLNAILQKAEKHRSQLSARRLDNTATLSSQTVEVGQAIDLPLRCMQVLGYQHRIEVQFQPPATSSLQLTTDKIWLQESLLTLLQLALTKSQQDQVKLVVSSVEDDQHRQMLQFRVLPNTSTASVSAAKQTFHFESHALLFQQRVQKLQGAVDLKQSSFMIPLQTIAEEKPTLPPSYNGVDESSLRGKSWKASVDHLTTLSKDACLSSHPSPFTSRSFSLQIIIIAKNPMIHKLLKMICHRLGYTHVQSRRIDAQQADFIQSLLSTTSAATTAKDIVCFIQDSACTEQQWKAIHDTSLAPRNIVQVITSKASTEVNKQNLKSTLEMPFNSHAVQHCIASFFAH